MCRLNKILMLMPESYSTYCDLNHSLIDLIMVTTRYHFIYDNGQKKKMNQVKEDLGTGRHVRPSYILPLKDKKYVYICRAGNPSNPNTSRQICFRRGRETFALCSRK